MCSLKMKHIIILLLSCNIVIMRGDAHDDVDVVQRSFDDDLSDLNLDNETMASLYLNSSLDSLDALDSIDLENEVNTTADHLFVSNLAQKEAAIKQAIANTMRNTSVKRNLAQVLPILRVMTPAQKLALASLVKRSVLETPETPGFNINEVNALFAGNNKNISSDLLLPISLDIANLFRKARHIDTKDVPHFQALNALPEIGKDDTELTTKWDVTTIDTDDVGEEMPEAQELRGNPPKRVVHVVRRKPPGRHQQVSAPFRRNIDRTVVINKVPAPPRPPGGGRVKPTKAGVLQTIIEAKDNKCDTVVNGICLETNDYPLESILMAVHRNKDMMNHLFAEYRDVNETLDSGESQNRRSDDNDKGYMCSSMVKYARPKKAKATSGKWKFVVNTPEHTQTLRIEKCLRPYDTCSYLTDNFKSRCMQVYNYHRLLTWDKRIGLHMDIFKVPTCCSCHIEGYQASYPPETHYPSANGGQQHHGGETYPGHDYAGGSDYHDPNAIVNENDYNAAVNYGEPVDFRKASGTINKPYAVNNRRPPTTNYHQKSITNTPQWNSQNSYLNNQGGNFDQGNVNYDRGVAYNRNNWDTRKDVSSGTDETSFSSPNSPYEQYVEAPVKRPQRPKSTAFKRGIQQPLTTRPQQRYTTPKLRNNYRRPLNNNRPQIPVHDLEYESSSNVQQKFNPVYYSTTQRLAPIPDNTYSDVDETESVIRYTTPPNIKLSRNTITKRVNYNYHPIIDFFEPFADEDDVQKVQKRMDKTTKLVQPVEEDGWKPVTQPNVHI